MHDAPRIVGTSAPKAMKAPSRTASRIAWAVLWLIPFGVLLTAAWLTPSPSGHSTHMQLGLPPCGFLAMTGVPCPGCGMTTAFAHGIRGHFVQSVASNPFGFMLFAMTVAWMPLATYGVWRGNSVIEMLDRTGIDKWGLLLVVSSMITWAVRVGTLLWLR